MSDAMDDSEGGPAVDPGGPSRFEIPFRHCQAKALGWIAEFSECLVAAEVSCPFRVPFGFGHFCRHPHHKQIAAATLSR